MLTQFKIQFIGMILAFGSIIYSALRASEELENPLFFSAVAIFLILMILTAIFLGLVNISGSTEEIEKEVKNDNEKS